MSLVYAITSCKVFRTDKTQSDNELAEGKIIAKSFAIDKEEPHLAQRQSEEEQLRLRKLYPNLNLVGIPNEECITCNTGSCHNNVTSKKDGKEYNVHITVNYDTNEYYVCASENSSADSPFDIFEIFKEEEAAVKFICDRFDWFKCF